MSKQPGEKGETALREVIEATLDWMAGLCGRDVPQRPSRQLRAAVKALGSEHLSARIQAESELCANRNHAAPLLRQAAHAQQPIARAVRAAVLLHKLHEKDGADMLRRMARDQSLRSGERSELLRHAFRDIVGPEHYLRQAAAAITLLEQRPESFKAIVRFRQAAQLLRFLEWPLPPDLLRRALVVRTVGGENLSLVRAVLQDDPDVAVEHVCMVRRDAVLSLLKSPDNRPAGPQQLRANPSAVDMLLHNLAHPSHAVKLTAMYGLELLHDPCAIANLLPIAQDTECPVRDDARRLIDRLNCGRPDALTLLRASLPDSDAPESLLRPTDWTTEDRPETLLRPPN